MFDIVNIFGHIGNMVTDPFAAARSEYQARVVIGLARVILDPVTDLTENIDIDFIDFIISMPH
jgi:hypothetical protein